MTDDREQRAQRGYWLALGFATSTTMWAVGYVGRLPAVMAPSWLILTLMLGAVGVWGWQAGRRTGHGWRAGVSVGATAAVVNMLILGSLLGSTDGTGGVRPSALWWIPGSIIVVAGLAGGAAAVGSRVREDRALEADFGALFTKVAVAATFLLVVAGGLVTSKEAGLAVVDWPNTFGTNMFLYPISRMTGGVFYEHAHRLFGALIGLTTVAVAVFIGRTERRSWVRWMALAAVVMVVAQGVLGGLRVTGRFTLSYSPEETAPSIVLAVVHGVVGQLFLGLMVALAVVTSRAWSDSVPAEQRSTSSVDRSLQSVLVALLLVQLIFGAVQRHFAEGLLIHITLAAAVTVVAIVAGARARGLYHGAWPVHRLGQLVIGAVTVQVALGIAALAVTQGRAVVGHPTAVEVTIATAHQATGAALLAVSLTLALWTRRLFSSEVG